MQPRALAGRLAADSIGPVDAALERHASECRPAAGGLGAPARLMSSMPLMARHWRHRCLDPAWAKELVSSVPPMARHWRHAAPLAPAGLGHRGRGRVRY